MRCSCDVYAMYRKKNCHIDYNSFSICVCLLQSLNWTNKYIFLHKNTNSDHVACIISHASCKSLMLRSVSLIIWNISKGRPTNGNLRWLVKDLKCFERMRMKEFLSLLHLTSLFSLHRRKLYARSVMCEKVTFISIHSVSVLG